MSRILLYTPFLFLVMFNYSCQDSAPLNQIKENQSELGWTKLYLKSIPIKSNKLNEEILAELNKAILPHQKAVSALEEDLGFHPRYSPLMDEISMFVSDGEPQFSLILIPVEQRGVAHVHQQNFIFIAISFGSEVIPVATLKCADCVLAPEGIELWHSNSEETLRLFVESAGPIFQGSASMSLNIWDVSCNKPKVKHLLAISGPETTLQNDSLKLDVRVENKAMTVLVQLGHKKEYYSEYHPKKQSLLDIEYKAKSVTVLSNQDTFAKISIP